MNSVTVISPQSGDTFGVGETIYVWVGFSADVTITGPPQLALTIGTTTRQAAYGSVSVGVDDREYQVFFYTVQSSDSDANGLSIAANALALNGGTIQSTGGTATMLGLGSHAVTDNSAYKVDGSTDNAPAVVGVLMHTAPQSGDTFGVGETLRVGVWFGEAVTVTDTPQLTVTIGTATRTLDYVVSDLSRQGLYFDYTVQAADRDTDGPGITSGALTLNGATIRDAGSNNAVLSLGSPPSPTSRPTRWTGASTARR